MDDYYLRIKKIILFMLSIFSLLEAIAAFFSIPEEIDSFFMFAYNESIFILVTSLAFLLFSFISIIFFNKLSKKNVVPKEEINPIQMTNGLIKINKVKKKKSHKQHPIITKTIIIFCSLLFFALIIGAYNYMAMQFTYDELSRDNGLLRTTIDTFGRITVNISMVLCLITLWLNYYKNIQKQTYYIILLVLSVIGTINSSLYYLGSFLYFPPISDLTLALLSGTILSYSIYELIQLRQINTVKKLKANSSSPKK